MKQSKQWSLIFTVLWVLQLVAEALALASVWRLDMLPDQYIVLLAAVLMLLWSLTGLMLLVPSRKSGGGKFRRGVACVLILAIVVGCAAVVTVVTDIYETMHEITNNEPETNTVPRMVYVRSDDPAESLADAADYTFAKIEGYDVVYVDLAIEKIQQELGGEITVVSYTTVPEMVDALFSGEVDALILNDANLALLENEEGYEDFYTKAKLLCELELPEQEIQPTKPQPGDDDPTEPSGDQPGTEPTESTEPDITVPSVAEPEDITNTPFLMYIGGSDTRSSRLTTGRNDVNILAVVNPETKQVLLINTPRDYYIANPAGHGSLDKLTHCGNYGVENSMEALSQLFGTRIDYYARINFEGFETFIDAIGGVTVYSDVSFTAQDGTWFQSGENHLSGEEALSFARERYALSGGDRARGENQMKVIRSVIQKLTSSTAIISGYADILDSLKGMFATNMEMTEISQLVKMQLSDMASWDILTYSVDGYGDMEYTYSDPGRELYVMWPDDDMVDYAAELIDRMVSGEVLTEADVG